MPRPIQKSTQFFIEFLGYENDRDLLCCVGVSVQVRGAETWWDVTRRRRPRVARHTQSSVANLDQSKLWNRIGKIVGDTSLPLLVAAATFQIQQREFEGFENGNWWSNFWLLLYDLRQEATWLLHGNKRNSSCSSQWRSFQAQCLNINWFQVRTNLCSQFTKI